MDQLNFVAGPGAVLQWAFCALLLVAFWSFGASGQMEMIHLMLQAFNDM